MAFTRDFSVVPVPCLDQTTFDASCGGSGTNTFTGKIIDRLAMGPRFNALQPVAFGIVDAANGTSTGNSRYASLSVKLQHSNTTSTSAAGATGWVDYSTAYQSCEQPLFIITCTTATSTGGNCAGYLSSAAGATTSTGIAVGASAPSWYEAQAANQYVRIVITPRLEASSSNGGVLTLSGSLLFGSPQYAEPLTTSTGLVIKSTA